MQLSYVVWPWARRRVGTESMCCQAAETDVALPQTYEDRRPSHSSPWLGPFGGAARKCDDKPT